MVKRYSASPIGLVEDPHGALVKWEDFVTAVSDSYDQGERDGYREGVQDGLGG